MHAPSEQILAYFDGTGTDDRGRLLVDVQNWTDEQLEGCHDQIQWMFPVPEPSKFNWKAPLLTPEIIEQFTPAMKEVLRVSLFRMLRFYGLLENPIREDLHWLHPMDHNMLRLTRILRCLNLLGLHADMYALFDTLTVVYQREQQREEPRILPTTYQWWSKAVNEKNW